MQDETWKHVLDGSAPWAVIHADCLDVLPLMPERSIAHVITDPPYGIQDAPLDCQGKTSARRGKTSTWHAASDWDASINPAWCAAACRVSGSVAWFGHWRKRSEVEQASTLPLRTEIVWAKDCHVGPPCPVAPRDERIWLFSESGVQPQGFETSVWDEPIIPTWARREHKNEKPVALMLRLVRFLAAPGDVVLDPFCGSGSTGVACVRLGVPFIGIEKDAAHAAVARERLAAECRGLNLKDARHGQSSIFDALKVAP